MYAWEQFLQQQEAELGSETIQKWLRSLKIVRFDACNLYLEAKDSFQALWFEEHIRSKVQTHLFNGNQKKIKVHLTVANQSSALRKSRNKKDLPPVFPSFQLAFDELDPHCLLENFIGIEENKLTYQFLIEMAGICRSPGAPSLGMFNPLYLYGPIGAGKTHLLMSLTQIFRDQGLKTIYVRAETFTGHVVTAIRAGEMSVFRQAYRNIDLLLVDDVHVFSRKGATQEEFFHTFNTLHLEGKQIILSANCAPQELQLIEPRLVSRFEWGIVLPLKPVKSHELSQVLLAKAKALKFPLAHSIASFMIETFRSNPKAIAKALEALILRLHLDKKHLITTLTVPSVKTILHDLIIEEQNSVITPSKIIQAAAEQYGIRIEDILGKAQTRDCVIPRQLAMHLCRYQLKLPFTKIGDIFFRDHSTVMSSVKQIQKGLDENDREISGSWHTILKKLQV
jgi:chromosomal replication initiator protein